MQQSAMTVTGISAKAYISENDSLRRGLFYCPHGTYYQAVVGIGGSTALVLHVVTDNAKEQHLVNA